MIIFKKLKWVVVCISIFTFVTYEGFSAEGDKPAEEEKAVELKPQKTCPVMGGGINKDLYADVKGKRIYVCCQGCIEAVKKDPDSALKKLNELGEKAQDIPIPQKNCPVMSGPINKSLYYDYNGKRIYVCCEGCLNVAKKDPAAYLKKLSDIGEYAENIPAEQTICPVMGGAVNNDLFVEYNGKKLYVCCKSCLEAVKKDPAKFALKIEEQLKKNKSESQSMTQNEKASPVENAKEASTWTCSMHPQIKSDKPGKCSICKMDLVPLKEEKAENTEESTKLQKDKEDKEVDAKTDNKNDE